MNDQQGGPARQPPAREREGPLRRWRRHYLAYQRLYPLWRALYFAHPELQLLMPPGPIASAMTLRHMDRRLRRRVVEILDGERVLGEHMDPAVAAETDRLGRAAGLAGLDLEAAVQAASLAAALHRMRGHLTLPRPDDAPDPADVPSAPGLEALDEVNLDLEVTRLETISAAYTDSPIVKQALTATGHAE